MPPVCRLGDIGSAHASFPETDVIETSNNTTVNSLGVHRQGDAIREHGSPSPSPVHPRKLASGSGNTFVNSKQVSIIGSPIDCGGFMVTGSGNTFVN